MNEWRRDLKADPITWLTDRDNPSVRYLTLIHLLGFSQDHPEVLEARRAITSNPRVVKILSKQGPEGQWGSAAEPYLPKYKSSYWQVMILGMLGLRRTLPSVRKAIEHVFQFQHPEGGFSECGEVGARKEYQYLKERAEKKERVMPPEHQWIQEHIHEFQLTCLTGNVCLALIRLGYASDRRVKRGLKWLVKVQNEDGGWLCPYWKAHTKDKHGCFMGTITPLDAFSELPARFSTSEIVNSMETGIEFLLKHRLFRADHHDFKVIKESWLTLGFPQFFYDILRGFATAARNLDNPRHFIIGAYILRIEQ